MRSSAARARRRHRAPFWWWCSEDEGGVVRVAELLDRNRDLLRGYLLAQFRREHAGEPRRVVVVPRRSQ
jgi:hypothetical protein